MHILITSTRASIGLLFALTIVFALPAIASAQGSGNGKGQGANLDKKCAKFVNCHDARDGRLDGRGPAAQTGSPYPITYPYPNSYPSRNSYPYPSTTRNRRIDRNGDADVDRHDRILRRRERNRRVERGDGNIDRQHDWRHRRTSSRSQAQ